MHSSLLALCPSLLPFCCIRSAFPCKGKAREQISNWSGGISVQASLSSLHIHTTGWDHSHSVKGAATVFLVRWKAKYWARLKQQKYMLKKTSLYKYSAERSYLIAGEKDNSTRCSQAVTHPSTNRAQHCLTSVIGRELVFSMWYGRCREFV